MFPIIKERRKGYVISIEETSVYFATVRNFAMDKSMGILQSIDCTYLEYL